MPRNHTFLFDFLARPKLPLQFDCNAAGRLRNQLELETCVGFKQLLTEPIISFT